MPEGTPEVTGRSTCGHNDKRDINAYMSDECSGTCKMWRYMKTGSLMNLELLEHLQVYYGQKV